MREITIPEDGLVTVYGQVKSKAEEARSGLKELGLDDEVQTT